MMRTALSWLVLTLHFVLLAYCDNLALLSGTLRRYDKTGCEDDTLGLTCPQGTSISVELAQYGADPHLASNLCPRPPPGAQSNHLGYKPCHPPTSLQYSLLQTVVEACQKKRQCKFQTSTKVFGGDPCPGIVKYVLVAYKCRPYEFRSKVACENDVVQLKCNPNSRIAVYSASYGRTEYESVQCPQPQGVPEETCLVSYATESVMQICHGKRRCTLSADAATFGNPCRKESRMYLKVVYTCVPRKVLREQYEDRPEEDEMLDVDDDTDYEAVPDDTENNMLPSPNLAGRHNSSSGHVVDPGRTLGPIGSPSPPNSGLPGNRTLFKDHKSGHKYRKSVVTPLLELADYVATDAGEYHSDGAGEADEDVDYDDDITEIPPLSLINCTLTIMTTPDHRSSVLGFVTHWVNTYTFLRKNKERLTLYVIVSVGAGMLCMMALLIGRLAWSRRSNDQSGGGKGSGRGQTAGATTSLPRPFTDDISEVEPDIDLTLSTPVTMVHHHSPPPAELWKPIVYELLLKNDSEVSDMGSTSF
ncbi:uncharacterized protein isoform X2 [Rhodnius prolixus]|uniref:uncharacterized protein isoform X2 n=1 Tax=Rhodnius prolixus TaxID=13249 RepID=UPI003D18B1E0